MLKIGLPVYLLNMGTPGPVAFEMKDAAPMTIVVTGQDGQKFDVNVAMIVLGVLDQGLTNPLDGMPIFQVASQLLMQVKRHADG